MDQVNTLRRYGLFDAKVPRYTSYPPANRFTVDTGTAHQAPWLAAVPGDEPVSLYIHIPFCRRLCWFCACRTQGTRTLGPVAAYVETLIAEVGALAHALGEGPRTMARLHLGGGTPTILSADLMDRLLDRIFQHFTPGGDFEFSIEIDPTEAAPEVLDVLAGWGMTRASIGVQDFESRVQDAIGRQQSFEITEGTVAYLRAQGVRSLNIDFLYGLPFQSTQSLLRTIDRIGALGPDRLALYGYAHVPHVSRRQVMIPNRALPDGQARFEMSQVARERLIAMGYREIGIDHFALPSDGLAKAAISGGLTRNFQGYTDDPCQTLIGLGASAISKFPQGFVQNAISTSAYTKRVKKHGLAGHKGFALSKDDRFIATLVDKVMCFGAIHVTDIVTRFPDRRDEVLQLIDALALRFRDLVLQSPAGLEIKDGYWAAARLIAAELDQSLTEPMRHSAAV